MTTTLLIPEKTDIEFEDVFAAWTKKGGQIKKLGKYWIKDDQLAGQPIAIYGNQAFAFVLAQIYNAELISPDDTLIARLEERWVKRTISVRQRSQVLEADFPMFIKPVIPKMFTAGVFKTLDEFTEATKGLPATEEILTSTIIECIETEARGFVMAGVVKDLALYEGTMGLEGGLVFLQAFIDENKQYLPGVVVIDIAYSSKTGWFVLEFNACWGAGLNGCNADKVIDCIIGATINAVK